MTNQKRLGRMSLALLLFACACLVQTVTAQTKPTQKKGAAQGAKRPEAKRVKATEPAAAAAATATPADPASEEALKNALDALGKEKLPAAERVARLEALIAANPAASAQRVRALESLTSARAALGDERLRVGDALGGIELFRRAVADAPLDSALAANAADKSDRLFANVVSQLPANLYVLGHPDAAFDLARRIEERVKRHPQRLLALAAFYLGVERADEAERLAESAVRLAPESAAAHQALGEAYRFNLRLDKAAEKYARALELNPQAASARKSLADLRRANGKPEAALTLYREQLAADPKDTSARAGLVLSLFETGQREEAERELQAALAEQPENLPLLVGAAYWYAAHNEGARALELAGKAVALEAREIKWVWARMAFARALLVENRPFEAERALRLARTIGRFPTLDYELASTMAAAGLYQEAAEELARTFSLKGGEIETRLAGRIPARAASFAELLAPERRASIFQYEGVENEAQGRMLKALLSFHLAVRTSSGERLDAAAERDALAAAAEFVSGDDPMRAFRHLYVASQLLQRGAALQTVVEQAEAAMLGVEAALNTTAAPVATVADELTSIRARAIAAGTTPNVPQVARHILSNVMRGRIEDLAGWSLYLQGKQTEAVARLRLATGVLPEGSPWWRAAQWHIGAALDATGNQKEALTAYVRAYKWSPEPTRRVVIETLYRKLNNGSLNGLERILNEPRTANAATDSVAAAIAQPPASTPATSGVSGGSGSNSPSLTASASVAVAAPSPTPSQAVPEQATPTEVAQVPPAQSVPTPTPTPTPQAQAEANTNTPPASNDTTAPVASPSPTQTPAPVAERTTTRTAERGVCALSVSESSLSLKNRETRTLTVSLGDGGNTDLARISALTRDWADIIILAEPRTPADIEANVARYTISSISDKAGTYTVTFNSPCGKKEVAIEVKT
ncbi:MAG TPA: tetratricopeptide repeat protein [Pyrinomonadaceae bacterium]|nr:tetratricopeptide repeat protein [Pyrinomonadaceae bacterium]